MWIQKSPLKLAQRSRRVRNRLTTLREIYGHSSLLSAYHLVENCGLFAPKHGRPSFAVPGLLPHNEQSIREDVLT